MYIHNSKIPEFQDSIHTFNILLNELSVLLIIDIFNKEV